MIKDKNTDFFSNSSEKCELYRMWQNCIENSKSIFPKVLYTSPVLELCTYKEKYAFIKVCEDSKKWILFYTCPISIYQDEKQNYRYRLKIELYLQCGA